MPGSLSFAWFLHRHRPVGVMDFMYPLTWCMSQHMPILGLLGLNGDSLVFSITFRCFLVSSY